MRKKHQDEQIGKACFENQDIDVVKLRQKVWQIKVKGIATAEECLHSISLGWVREYFQRIYFCVNRVDHFLYIIVVLDE